MIFNFWPANEISVGLLPNEYNTPVFWSEEDKEELTGSFILDRMAADLEGFESEYNEVFVDGLFVVSTNYIQHLNIRVAKLNCVHNNAPCDVALGRFFRHVSIWILHQRFYLVQ